ncbi:MAG: SDR family oxidoreductase [Ruminococcus sp.]|nr:SDR family oxidoreductase [Ruminococcus sp.]
MQKTALVTGASRGIGHAVAKLLLSEHYRVMGISRTLPMNLPDLIPLSADLSDLEQLPQVADEVLNALGHIDVLVHNAGISCHGLFQEIPEKKLQKLYALNLAAPIQLTRLLLPSMLQRHKGNIICISSIWGETGASCEVDYSVTKGGLIAFVKGLAKEVGLSGIRVNAVSPGTICTDMMIPLGAETLKTLTDETALGRLGTAMDVAQLVSFLASDQSDYITGQNISINGGVI